MHGIGRTIGAFALALAAAAPAAGAQLPGGISGSPGQHRIRVGLGGGMDVPTSSAGDVFRSGMHGQGFVLINLGVLPAIRLNLGYSRFNFKDAMASGVTGGDTRVLGGVAGMKIDLLPGPVRPYLLAGVGAFNVQSTVLTADGSSTASQTKLGVDGGAGLSFHLGRVNAFVEGRVQNIYTDQGAIDPKSIRSVPVTSGVIIWREAGAGASCGKRAAAA